MEDLTDSALTWCDEKRKKDVQDELSSDEVSISSTLPRLILPFCLYGLLRFLFTLAFR